MRTNTTDLEVLARTHLSNPELVGWLNRRLKSTEEMARKAREEVDVRWAQGRAQELAELITALEGSADNLRKASDRASK